MVHRPTTGNDAKMETKQITEKLSTWTFSGADDGIRTRDPHLGKVM
jgi:hypothetical protein